MEYGKRRGWGRHQGGGNILSAHVCEFGIFCPNVHINKLKVTSKDSREASGEGFFRQSKQKFAHIVDPIRRIFVTNDGKSTPIRPSLSF